MATDNSNLYDDGPPGEGPSQPADPEPTGAEGQTTIIPKSVVGGQTLNPGDPIQLQVVADHGDEYEVKMMEAAPVGKPQKTAAGGGGEMASMLED